MKVLLLAFLLFSGSCLPAQSDSETLLKEAEIKLKSKTASISDILSDKKYLPLHPNTAFRDIIKQYSTTAALKITTADEPGKKIRVVGTIKNKDGQPIADALVYLYQTDARGWYAADVPHVLGNEGDTRHARLFGYVKTGKNGNFEMHTVKPSGYPQSDLPAHIHVHVMADGYNPFVNEFLFDDDERLVGAIREQSIRNKFFISKPEKAALPFVQQFSYTVMLEKK
jgi:protocatechuate 3,4-dioxygenase beta subunit